MAVTTTSMQSIDIVNEFMDDVFNGREYGRIADLQSEDYVQHGTISGVEIHGNEESEEMIRMFHAAFSDLESTDVLTVAVDDGEYVCSVRRFTGTNDGEFMGHPPTDATVDVMGLSLYRMENGQIAERWNAVDFLGLLQQLDMVPSLDDLAA